MAARNSLFEMVGWLVSSTPYVLVLLAGFIASIVVMNRYPKPALLVAIGTALLLANAVVLTFVQQWGMQLMSGNRGIEEMRVFMYAAGFVRSLVSAVGIGLLIVACFIDRKATSSDPLGPSHSGLPH